MVAGYIAVTAVTAAANAYGAVADFQGASWILDNMTKYGVPHSWLVPLGVLKAAGAMGLIVGIFVPMIGIAAAAGLILYFIGAIITVTRARWYSHLPYPTIFLLLAAASLVLRLSVS